jgi:hypothetical protein
MNSAWDKIKKIVPNMYGAQALLDWGFIYAAMEKFSNVKTWH